jgi:hypothetical protein
MKERGIIFNGEMVRQILSGNKTMTRRVINPQPEGLYRLTETGDMPWNIGQRLWVRETCHAEELFSGLDVVRYHADNAVIQIENTREASTDWCILNCYRHGSGETVPSIHMPRWASRITLEITDVRVERIHEITRQDAVKEGIEYLPDKPGDNVLTRFIGLWNSLNEKRGYGWSKHPWVWVLEFKVVK